ncbi:IS200/IS605 family transposase [Streptomyces sp. NPDC055059]
MPPRWKPNPNVRTGRHVVHNLHVHLVFVTKYRRKAFSDKMLKRCEEIMREACTDFEAELKQFNGEENQLLEPYPPKVQLSKLVNSRKASPPGSYFAGSCGGAPLTVVRQYIENQKRPVG